MPEERIGHIHSDDGNRSTAEVILVTDKAAIQQSNISNGGIGGSYAGDGGGLRLTIELHDTIPLHHRSNGLNMRSGVWVHQRSRVIYGDWARIADVFIIPCPAEDKEQVCPHLVDGARDGGGGAISNGQHGDDSGNTDHYAKHRQAVAQLIGVQTLKGLQEYLGNRHFCPSSSVSTTPSRIWMMR